MSLSLPRVPHQPGRMADLTSRTRPTRTVPRGRHRAPRPVDIQLHLTTLALGALLAGGIYITGGPW